MKRIGIKNLMLGNLNGVKKEALFFDEIIFDIDSFQKTVHTIHDYISPFTSKYKIKATVATPEAEIDFLIDKGILKPYQTREVLFQALKPDLLRNASFLEGETKQFMDLVKREFDYGRSEFDYETSELRNEVSKFNENFGHKRLASRGTEIQHYLAKLLEHNTHRVKLLTMLKSLVDNDNFYVPILTNKEIQGNEKLLKEHSLSHLVLKQFPNPDASVSWEQLLEFRQDEDAKNKLLALRHWITRMSAANLSPRELEEEVTYLIHEYEQTVKLHKMKYGSGTLELIVVTSLEVLENLLKLNWSSAAKKIFQIKKQKVDFLIEERNFTGREMAYITKALDIFG